MEYKRLRRISFTKIDEPSLASLMSAIDRTSSKRVQVHQGRTDINYTPISISEERLAQEEQGTM